MTFLVTVDESESQGGTGRRQRHALLICMQMWHLTFLLRRVQSGDQGKTSGRVSPGAGLDEALRQGNAER